MKVAVFFLAVAIAAVASCRTNDSRAALGTASSARVTFENDKVRVIEYHSGSQKDVCGAAMHTHPAHVYIMLTDAKLRVVTPDGKESFEAAKAGDVGWESTGEHICQDLTGKDVRCYLIEIKDKDWKPSTGLTK